MHSDWMNRYNLLMFNELGSTNIEAAKLASSAPIGNFVIWAKSQFAGKGRAGRQWESKEGNLYMSILLQSDAPIEDQAQVSFVASLSVADAISSLMHNPKAQVNKSSSVDVRLKWPNDVMVNDKKIAGILLESVKVGDKNYLIIGIGVNLDNHPDILDKPTSSLKLLDIAYISVEQILNLIMSSFEKYYNLWHEGYGFAKIRELWLAKAYKFKDTITVSDGKQRISGLFEDLDMAGSIMLRLTSGQICTLYSCEIFFGNNH